MTSATLVPISLLSGFLEWFPASLPSKPRSSAPPADTRLPGQTRLAQERDARRCTVRSDRTSVVTSRRQVSRIADVTVERLDVVAARVEQERCVVTGRVRSVAGRTVGAKAGPDAGTVEAVHLLPRSRDEAQV